MFLLSIFWGLSLAALVRGRTLPKSYDVIYDSPAPPRNGSSSSMPVGGGDIGLNVWVENATLLFYIGKDGCFDENNSLLKLGRVRLELDPNPLADGQDFEQRLNLEDGYVRISAGDRATIVIWVDVYDPVVHVEISTPGHDTNITASLETWRHEDHMLELAEQSQTSWNGIPDQNIVTWKDNVSFWHEDSIILSHRNRNARVFDATLAQQQLTDYKDGLFDPLTNNTFGVLMYGEGLEAAGTSLGLYVNSSFRAWKLRSRTMQRSFSLTLVAHVNQTSTYQGWEDEIVGVKNAGRNNHGRSIDWWHSFWERSYITVNTNSSADDPSFQVGRNYQLFRYMLGCNAGSNWPTRFNGGVFTFDPVFVNPEFPYSPDFRLWGGGSYTQQNQRLLYWPLLKSGDIDMMKPQFDFYNNILATTLLRGRVFYGINHSWIPEQLDNFGLPKIFELNSNTYIYGTKRPLSFNAGFEFNAWLTWLFDTALEFAMMILDAVQYKDFDPTPYIAWIEHEIMWFDVLYTQMQQSRDAYGLTGTGGNESLVIYPGSGCETYKAAYNPASTVSGLRAVVNRILQVNPKFVVGNTSYYEGLLQRIPPTPKRLQQGRECIAPAEVYARIQNVEIPQMYPVFPWHEYGVGLPNLSHAVNTYLYDTETQAFHGYDGWNQDAIWLADMGLTEMARNVTQLKLQDTNVNRFPAFWGPGFDWTPQMDTGGTGMIALQEMLMQTYGNESRVIRLLPAWPNDWTLEFKLHAPFETTVAGRVEQGALVRLEVDPPERRGDVIVGKD